MTTLALNGDPSSSFVARDFERLAVHFATRVVHYHSRRDLSTLRRAIAASDGVLSWFADTPAFVATVLARIHRRPSVVIVGGYEVADQPSLGYGLQALPGPRAALRRRQLRWTLRHADTIVAVSEFSRGEILRVARPRALQVIPNAVDGDQFRPLGPKERRVMTVATVRDQPTYSLKGVAALLECARALPDVPFLVGGIASTAWVERIQREAPPNLTVQGRRTAEELIPEYQRSWVYLQPSLYESFGLSVVEAMACGCVPVVTDRGALPEVVGDAGLVVPAGEAKTMVEALGKALADKEGAARARARAVERFSLEERISEITDLLGKVLVKGRGPRRA